MSRTSETKNRILKMLKEGNKRLMDICPELKLSPPTVSQHLKELKAMHLIEEVPDQHFKNEKYYRLVNDQAMRITAIQNRFPRYVIGVIAIAVITSGLFAYGIIAGQLLFGQNSQQNMLNILLTDPPHVPIGTQSLNITYSGVQLHVVNKSIDEWININSTGSVNLLSLVNVSKLIASARMPANAMIDAATFNITRASITVANVTYPVYLQNRKISTTVTDSLDFNGTSSLLLDFSPTILPVSLNGSLGFVMLPSIAASMVSGHMLSVGSGPMRSHMALNRLAMIRLNRSEGAISIAYANITTYGNATHVEITVNDDSSKNVSIEHVLLIPITSSNAIGIAENESGRIAWMGEEDLYPIDFSVSRNGSLAQSKESGFDMVPGKTASLSFNGTMPGRSGKYAVMIVGTDCAFAMYPPHNGNVFYITR